MVWRRRGHEIEGAGQSRRICQFVELVACRRDFVTTDVRSEVLYSDQHVGRDSHTPRQA